MVTPYALTMEPHRRISTRMGSPRVLALAGGLLLAGCHPADERASSEADAGTLGEETRIDDRHNYRTQSTLSLPVIETAAGVDVELCWDEVTLDLQCHALDPTRDIDNFALLRFRGLSHAALERKLVSTQLSMSDILGYLDHNLEGSATCARLSDLDFFGTQVDVLEQYVEDETISYMALFTTGTQAGTGARTMVLLEPNATSSVTEVQVPAGCGDAVELHFEAEFSEKRLTVPAKGPWLIDWHDVEFDGAGHPLDEVRVDGVLVGFYAGMSVSELEARILDLELLYTKLWQQPVERGKSAALSQLVERDTGEAFTGFETDEAGTWVLGLTCSTCQNPAPVVLTVLDPAERAP